jgi:O-antigen biosynthesis protein
MTPNQDEQPGLTNVVPDVDYQLSPPEVPPLVSIVLPVWNRAPETADLFFRAVLSIAAHVQVPCEVIAVNNASAYWKFPYAELQQAKIPWMGLYLPVNRGFGPAVNLGAKLARGKYLCQMNSDAALIEDSVSLLISAMEKHGIDLGTVEHFENCLHYGLGKSDHVMGEDWFFGAFWIIRKEVWDAVGGFDEGYQYFYWEDSALVRTLRKAGYRVAGTRSTWVSHVGGASSHPDRDKYFELNRKRFEAQFGEKNEA